MQPLFFTIRERPKIDWGDYGRILQHGMGLMVPRRDGLIVLLRTGPFIPPITFPGWPSFDSHGSGVVVVDSVRIALEASGLSGLTFQAVVKGRIVWLPWHEWDLKAERPRFPPLEGEPENYILEDTHSTKASDALGDLWEVVAKPVDWLERYVEQSENEERIVRFRFASEQCGNSDFFCVRPTATLLCSAKAKTWIENHWSDWVSFVPLNMT